MRKVCLLLLIIACLYSACKKEAAKNIIKPKDSVISVDHDTLKVTFNIPDTTLSKYNSSYTAWLSYKQQHNNSYTYTINSVYVEPSNNVSITTRVQDGVVVARDYIAFVYVAGPQTTARKDTTEQWHEQGVTLNTHPDGGQAMTLDDIYLKAKTMWLNVDPAKNAIYFETKNGGLISECGSYPNGCQDNCFLGVQNISPITTP
jgi:hypothetical protein